MASISMRTTRLLSHARCSSGSSVAIAGPLSANTQPMPAGCGRPSRCSSSAATSVRTGSSTPGSATIRLRRTLWIRSPIVSPNRPPGECLTRMARSRRPWRMGSTALPCRRLRGAASDASEGQPPRTRAQIESRRPSANRLALRHLLPSSRGRSVNEVGRTGGLIQYASGDPGTDQGHQAEPGIPGDPCSPRGLRRWPRRVASARLRSLRMRANTASWLGAAVQGR